MLNQNLLRPFLCGTVLTFSIALVGCGTNEPSPLDAPMRYNSNAELKARLEEVAKYGDGGSSLGGIPESIAELTKTDPAKGEKLLSDFKRLDITDSKEERRKIAKEMADQLKD